MPTLELALACQVFLWLVIIGVFWASDQASIYHPLTVYLGFHGLVFVVRPLLVHYLNFDTIWNYMRMQPSDADLMLTLAVSSTALVVFGLTCLSFGYGKTKFATPSPEPFSKVQRKALVLTTLLLAPLVVYSIHSLMGGGLQGRHIGGTFIMTGASGYTLEAQFMAGPLICAWLVVTRFNWTSLLPLILYVGYRSYTGWNRWTIVLLFLGVALVYGWQKRIRWVPAWAVGIAVPLFFLFMLLGQNRDYFRQKLAGENIELLQEWRGDLSKREMTKLKYDTQEFANFDFLCFVIAAVPDRTGTYTYGAQYLQLFTEPIPRKLWKGKPAGAPVRLFNLNAYGNFLGLTPTLTGDGWMSGGWVGVIVTMGLVGVALGLAHRWFWTNAHQNMAALFYLVALAMTPQWFRDGGISIAKFLFWNLFPLVVWLGFTWLLGSRLVPAYSVLLPPGTRVRLIPTPSNRPPLG